MTRSKYRAIPVVIDGHRFASKAEGRRYTELRLLEQAGEIDNLELQPRFDLIVAGIDVGTYVADFRYLSPAGVVIEDVKGVRTPVYKLKKRLVRALHGVEIVEVP